MRAPVHSILTAVVTFAAVSACTVNLPSSPPTTVIITPTTPEAVTVTADPAAPDARNPSNPPSPGPTRTITVTPTPTPATTRPPERSDYRNWLCSSSAEMLPAITPGESSNSVRLLQWSLTQVGYYNAAVGGNYGNLTLEATSRFQLDNGLGGSGNVAINTWSWLQYYLCWSDSTFEYINP